MDGIFQLRAGRLLVLPLAIGLGLMTADALWTLRVYRKLRTQTPAPAPGYEIGLLLGVWHLPLLVALAGVFALYGSRIALIIFSAGVMWRALGPGREAVAGFLAGYRDASGQLDPVLASAFGAAWVLVTRGIPLGVFVYALLWYKP